MTVIIISILLTAIIVASYILKKPEFMLSGILVFFTMELDIEVGLNFGAHYILLFTMIVIFLLEYRKRNFDIKRPLKIFLLSWAVTIVIYAIGYFVNGDISRVLAAAIKFIGSGAYVLQVALLVLLFQLYSKKQIKKSIIMWLVFLLSINFIFTFLQMYFPIIGEKLLRLLVDTGSFNIIWDKYGYFIRGFGIYGSPVLLGAVCLLVLSLIIPTTINSNGKEKIMYYILIFLFGLTGLFSYTKTTILGYPLFFIIVTVVLFSFYKNLPTSQNLKQTAIFFAMFTAIFAVWYFLTPPGVEQMRDSYLRFLGESSSAVFDSRMEVLATNHFDENTNELILSSTSIIKEHLLIGVGPLSLQGEYLHDMQYVSLLHNGGILAFLSLGSMYVYLFIVAIKNKKIETILILIVLALLGLAFESLTNTIIVPFVAMVLYQLSSVWTKETVPN